MIMLTHFNNFYGENVNITDQGRKGRVGVDGGPWRVPHAGEIFEIL